MPAQTQCPILIALDDDLCTTMFRWSAPLAGPIGLGGVQVVGDPASTEAGWPDVPARAGRYAVAARTATRGVTPVTGRVSSRSHRWV